MTDAPDGIVGTVLLVGVAISLATVPVMMMMNESATANGMARGATSAMINIVFAAGELVCAPHSSVLDDQRVSRCHARRWRFSP